MEAREKQDVERLMSLATELDDYEGLEAAALAQSARGLAHQMQDSYSEALVCFEKALEMCVNMGHTVESADMDMNIGGVYEATGDFPQALKHYTQALKKYELANIPENIARVLGSISSVYSWFGDNQKALENALRELDLKTDLGDRAGLASAEARLGSIYTNLDQFDNAITHQQRAVELYDELGDVQGMAAREHQRCLHTHDSRQP